MSGHFHLTSSWRFFHVSTSCRGLSFFIDGSTLFHECDVIYLPTVILIDIELILVWSYYKESCCEHFFPGVILDADCIFSRIYSLKPLGSRTRQIFSFRIYDSTFQGFETVYPPTKMYGRSGSTTSS